MPNVEPQSETEEPNNQELQLMQGGKAPPFFNTRMSLGRTFFPGSVGFRTLRVSRSRFLKGGAHIGISEAEAMQYVAEHTSIPVPKLRRAWSADGRTYILMDVVGGEELAVLWNKMSTTTQRRVIDQLKGYLAELRALEPPTPGLVASAGGGPLRDGSRVGLEEFGPFNNHNDFHQFLRKGWELQEFAKLEGSKDAVIAHREQYVSKFTHGDFAPRNIMVKRDGTVTAIIDWDSAGWYPEYWEFTKANFTPNAREDCVSSTGEMMGTYKDQLEGERRLWKLCGYDIT